MRHLSGVYWIVHQKTGRFYIGSTGNFEQRKNIHLRSLLGGYHFNKELQSDYNRDPSINFEFFETKDKSEALVLEQKHLNQHFISGRLYNVSSNAVASILGGCDLNRGEDWRKSQSVAKNDKKKPVVINGIKYESIKEAARSLNVCHAALSYRVRSTSDKFKDWKFL